MRATQLVDLLLTEDDKHNEVTLRRARFLRYSLLTTLVLSVFYALCLHAIEYAIGVWVLVSFVVLHLFFLFLLWKKAKTAVVGNAYCAMTVMGYFALCITSNGIASGTIIWFFATIVSGFWFVGRRAGYYWAAASLLVVVGLFISEALGVHYSLTFPARYYYIYAGIAYTGALLYAVVVVITYENWQLSAVKRAEGQAQALHAQKQEIENQRDTLEQVLRELKAAQIQLIQSAKMASLGELTAGIAHEIQNPLNFVNNFSEVSTELVDELIEGPFQQLPAPEQKYAEEILGDLTQNLQKISHHGSRASNIVKGMLEHSRSSTGELQQTDLNALADEYLHLSYRGQQTKYKTASADRFHCELITNFDAELGLVEVVFQDIGRVLLNLFNNAFYAVEQRQLLAGEHYRPTVSVSTERLTNAVEVRVSDNGVGIPEPVKSKIFQPFFTTKPTGEGTGLGLSLSYDIITKGHGGTLTVESRQDQETVFTISFPLP